MGKIVGIDLGTTFSAVAYIDDNGAPQIIPNKEGDRTTPSTVLFGEKTIIGKTAKKKSISSPHNYEAFVKRHMGDKTYSFTTKEGKSYHAEEISALILQKLKEDAEAYLGDEISGAVITVPAYFSDPQRQATKDAAELAHIPVLDIINEPTAAAIAFGVNKGVSEKKCVMVYDFGGGTFDVSILDIDENTIKVLATNGDPHLGGYDIDKAIFDYVAMEASNDGIDITSDKRATQDLMLAAEEAKKELSSCDSADITIYVHGEEFSVTIDREIFENDIADGVLSTTMSIMQRTLDESGLSYDQIDTILLVGGSTRIPSIKSMIKDETGIAPSSEVHPDEAVAIGAAYHAVDVAQKHVNFDTDASNEKGGTSFAKEQKLAIPAQDIPSIDKNYEFKDVTSHGIGIVVLDSELNKNKNCVLIPKNTEIPAKVVQDGFSTVVPNQTELKVNVTQGEFEEIEATTIIGKAVLSIRPRDYRVPIRVIVSCDENALIHVEAYDLDDNVNLGEIKVSRDAHNLSEKEMKQAEEKLNELNIG